MYKVLTKQFICSIIIIIHCTVKTSHVRKFYSFEYVFFSTVLGF